MGIELYIAAGAIVLLMLGMKYSGLIGGSAPDSIAGIVTDILFFLIVAAGLFLVKVAATR